MAKAEFCIKLEWKEFNVSVPAMHAWCQANAGEQYCGAQAVESLELWFLENPGDEVAEAIADKWASIEEDSDEATSYKSKEDIESDEEAKRASGKAKLLALGLSEEEISAMKLA